MQMNLWPSEFPYHDIQELGSQSAKTGHISGLQVNTQRNHIASKMTEPSLAAAKQTKNSSQANLHQLVENEIQSQRLIPPKRPQSAFVQLKQRKPTSKMEGVHKMEDLASVKSKAAGPAISTLGDTLAIQKRGEMAATSIGTVS